MPQSNNVKTKPTPAQKRLQQANDYLKSKDIDINSLADIHYKHAIEIAAGVKR